MVRPTAAASSVGEGRRQSAVGSRASAMRASGGATWGRA